MTSTTPDQALLLPALIGVAAGLLVALVAITRSTRRHAAARRRTPARPQIGMAVIIRRGDQVLVGRRRGSHQAGKWSFPGGKLEMGEAIVAAARREVREEAGLELGAVTIVGLANNWMPDAGAAGVQFLTLYLHAEAEAGEAETREPDKCEGWRWVPVDQVPQPHMTPLTNLRALGLDGVAAAAPTPESLDFHRLADLPLTRTPA